MFLHDLSDLLGAYKERAPAARSKLEILLLYPGVHAVIWHRIAHTLHKLHLRFLARLVSQLARFLTGIEIHPAAKIGKRLVIDHGMGIVIGETAEVGDDVLLYQGVTLGGSGKEHGKRHPTLGNNILVGSGAKILGSFRIGDNARIAANAVVLREVPPNATVVGVPAKIARIAGVPLHELDHVHIPDPIAQDLTVLRQRIDTLEKALWEKNHEDKGEQ
jgi:serine O-acetyltransferase